MSAVLGIVSDRTSPDDAIASRMLERMKERGADRTETWRDDDHVLLGTARGDWELADGLSGSELISRDTHLAVAADASFYYRDDLLRSLADVGIRPRGASPGDLILAAYRAWGDQCLQHLEGDFAFVLWDGRGRRALCARSWGGLRPLHYVVAGETLVAASTPSGVAAHPACTEDLDLATIGAFAAGLFNVGHKTCYANVRTLPAGSYLVWEGGSVSVTRFWELPSTAPDTALSFEAATEELKRLIQHAVQERFARRGPTSLWLSGGWDSTAVLAAGESVLSEHGNGEHLSVISMSYPPGDPGREDELIEAVAARWDVPVEWVQSSGIPLLDAPEQRAADRGEPFAHPFEMWNRALARRSRESGSRVILVGNGGDEFLHTSNVYLADLFRTGRWLKLYEEWKAKGWAGSNGRRFLFRVAVQPNLPEPLLRAIGVLRGGRPLRPLRDTSPPEWMDSAFLQRNQLVERDRANTPVRGQRSWTEAEMLSNLTSEYSPRVTASIFTFGLEEGVELRAPLLDPRVVRFAASRPREERSSGRETKRLLRHAMRGLLPEHVLAPRPYKTGVPNGYFDHFMRDVQRGVVVELVEAPLALADCGIVRASVFRERVRDYMNNRNDALGMRLFFTLQTELWLRARIARPTEPYGLTDRLSLASSPA